jgi:Polysaccharide lyase
MSKLLSRRRSIGASFLAPPIGPTPPAAFVCDFEDGTLNAIPSQQESSANRIQLTTSNPLQGNYSALVTCGAQDQGVAGSGGSWRTEMAFNSLSSIFGGGSLVGKQTWVTWYARLMPGWAYGSTWAVISQLLGTSGSGWPMFGLEANGPAPGKLMAIIRGGAVNVSTQEGLNPKAVMELINPLPIDTLLKVKVYHRWSTTSTGIVRVWINNVLRGEAFCPNLFIGFESTPYHKLGIYRSSSGSPADSSIKIDNIRWYTSDPGNL